MYTAPFALMPFFPTGNGSLFPTNFCVPRVQVLLAPSASLVSADRPSLRDSNRQRPHTRNHSNPLGHRNRSARIQNVEQVRALQAQLISRQ